MNQLKLSFISFFIRKNSEKNNIGNRKSKIFHNNLKLDI